MYMEDPYEVFVCFVSMLNRHFFFDFYRLERDKIDLHLRVFDALFAEKLPVLHGHFRAEGVAPELYYFEWSMTIFVKFLPLDIAARIWDSYLYVGETYFIRSALGKDAASHVDKSC